MALRRNRQAVAIAAHPQPTSLVAAAVQVNLKGRSWRTYKFGDDAWQQEAWRLYDIIGELRYVANWMGSACSRVRIYVAEVDDYGRIKKEVTNKKIAGYSDALFGSPAARAEALRMHAINLTIAGDVYVVGRGSDPEGDEWMVVSCSELKRYGNGGDVVAYLYDSDDDGTRELLDPEKDIVIRIWTPHPRRHLWPDSPTRAAMPMLWEIERLTRFVFAQIDSRLVSAGLVPIPKEVSFPDTEDPTLSGAEQLTERLMKTGSASLQGAGTAAGVVPTFVEMPTDALGKIELIQFTSELSKQALDLRKEAIERFALAMDIDPMILHGAGDANHWGSYQITEGQIKVHVEPLLTRIVDGWTKGILKPALKRNGEDPDRYIYWFDTAPLTVRPQRLKDTFDLWKEHLVSNQAVLDAGSYREGDAPTDEEELKYFTRKLMERDPNLFQIPAVRKVAGYTDEILPPDQVTPPPGTPGALPPAPPTGIGVEQPPLPGAAPSPEPVGSTAANALGTPEANASNTPPAQVASAVVPSGVFALANACVVRAMEVAGKRLLDRSNRGKLPGVVPYEIHTHIRVNGDEHAAKLLQGAWDYLPLLTVPVDPDIDTDVLEESLDEYCATLLVKAHPHHPSLLYEYLYRRGVLHGFS
jgi:hypothetical protein